MAVFPAYLMQIPPFPWRDEARLETAAVVHSDEEAPVEVTARRSLIDRMIGAALLKVDVYEEVEHDESATGQAAIVVGMVAVAAAIGSWSYGSKGIISGLVTAFVAWFIWSGVTYFIGDKLFKGTATWGELLRTIGFAQAPGVLFLFGIIPVLGFIPNIAVPIWLLFTGVVAIRQALDFSTGKAILTALIGWLIIAVLQFALAGALGLNPA